LHASSHSQPVDSKQKVFKQWTRLQKNRINSKSLYEDLQAQHLSMFCANQIGRQFVFGSKTQKLRQHVHHLLNFQAGVQC
jgi:hypothetical protein